ncbi:MAG: hypothetical protein LBU64_13550 [Planctomycetota bacterium]|jgi:hypothetical protein|nr:hypothetical protein [Planctomycetota bacterium]
MDDLFFSRDQKPLLREALPGDSSSFGILADTALRQTYLPSAHGKALQPDNIVVTGIRGSGKTFWWAALQNPEIRPLVEAAAQLGDNAVISVGYGVGRENAEKFPAAQTLAALAAKKIPPRHIWMTVVYGQVLGERAPSEFPRRGDWERRIRWVIDHPDLVSATLSAQDALLAKNNQYHLVLFDALDTTANDWKAMNRITRGVLQVGVEIRSYRKIRTKIFLRPDQLDDPEATSFNDASKITGNPAELEWKYKDLYGMLWHLLANDRGFGPNFRKVAESIAGVAFGENREIREVPNKLRSDPDAQRGLFHALTGPWMGRDRRRGAPYTWLPKHLGDNRGAVSPRSFLTALRTAAESGEYREDWKYPLHFEDIKAGVRQASLRRVRELNDDYPWIQTLMEPIGGMNVPCGRGEVFQRWKRNGALEAIGENPTRLPPAHLKDGPEKVLKDLQELGIVAERDDGRINIPDVYRVGYGLGRHGGIKRG